MKHDDNTLQAAIDAAMIEIETGTQHKSLDTYVSNYWHRESPARLALAKAFLAKLPEAQPILADDGRSLGQVAKEAFIGAPGSTDDWMNAAAQAVASVVLAQAVRRMEAVTMAEIADIIRKQWLDKGAWIEPAAEAVRARLIAAARGEERPLMTKNIPADKCPLCGAEEVESNTPNTVYACGSSDYDGRPGTFHPGDKCEARGEPYSTDCKDSAEIEAMREAIKEAFSSFADEPESDAAWLLNDRQRKALAKLKPFIKP